MLTYVVYGMIFVFMNLIFICHFFDASQCFYNIYDFNEWFRRKYCIIFPLNRITNYAINELYIQQYTI